MKKRIIILAFILTVALRNILIKDKKTMRQPSTPAAVDQVLPGDKITKRVEIRSIETMQNTMIRIWTISDSPNEDNRTYCTDDPELARKIKDTIIQSGKFIGGQAEISYTLPSKIDAEYQCSDWETVIGYKILGVEFYEIKLTPNSTPSPSPEVSALASSSLPTLQYELAELTVRARVEKIEQQDNGIYILKTKDDPNLFCTANPAIQRTIKSLLFANFETLYVEIKFRAVHEFDLEGKPYGQGGCPKSTDVYIFVIRDIAYGYTFPPSTQAAVTLVPTLSSFQLESKKA